MKIDNIEQAVDFALSERSIIQLDWGPTFGFLPGNSHYRQYYNFLKYLTLSIQKQKINKLNNLIDCDHNIIDYEGITIFFEPENLNQYPKNSANLTEIIKARSCDVLIYPITGNFIDEIKDACQSRSFNYENLVLKFNQDLFKKFNSKEIELNHIITCSKDFKTKSVGLNSIEYVRNEIILGELNLLVTNAKIFKFQISLGEHPYITFCHKKFKKTFKSE